MAFIAEGTGHFARVIAMSVALILGGASVANATFDRLPTEEQAVLQRLLDQGFMTPDSPQLMWDLGQAATDTLDYDEAISAYERLMIYYPRDPVLRLELAIMYFRISSLSLSKRNLEKANEIGGLSPAEQRIANELDKELNKGSEGWKWISYKYIGVVNDGLAISEADQTVANGELAVNTLKSYDDDALRFGSQIAARRGFSLGPDGAKASLTLSASNDEVRFFNSALSDTAATSLSARVGTSIPLTQDYRKIYTEPRVSVAVSFPRITDQGKGDVLLTNAGVDEDQNAISQPSTDSYLPFIDQNQVSGQNGTVGNNNLKTTYTATAVLPIAQAGKDYRNEAGVKLDWSNSDGTPSTNSTQIYLKRRDVWNERLKTEVRGAWFKENGATAASTSQGWSIGGEVEISHDLPLPDLDLFDWNIRETTSAQLTVAVDRAQRKLDGAPTGVFVDPTTLVSPPTVTAFDPKVTSWTVQVKETISLSTRMRLNFTLTHEQQTSNLSNYEFDRQGLSVGVQYFF